MLCLKRALPFRFIRWGIRCRSTPTPCSPPRPPYTSASRLSRNQTLLRSWKWVWDPFSCGLGVGTSIFSYNLVAAFKFWCNLSHLGYSPSFAEYVTCCISSCIACVALVFLTNTLYNRYILYTVSKYILLQSSSLNFTFPFSFYKYFFPFIYISPSQCSASLYSRPRRSLKSEWMPCPATGTRAWCQSRGCHPTSTLPWMTRPCWQPSSSWPLSSWSVCCLREFPSFFSLICNLFVNLFCIMGFKG